MDNIQYKLIIRECVSKLSLLLLAIFITLFIIEFILFKYIVIGSNLPTIQFVDKVMKFLPNQSGIYRLQNEIETVYSINNNGWNSQHNKYSLEKSRKRRLCIVGDSYVEAFQIDFNESLAERIEDLLDINKTEVFRFGISGAPLSQYYYMLKNEVLKYNPDDVIVVLAHNDFDESYAIGSGRYKNMFLTLNIGDNVVQEVEPNPSSMKIRSRLLEILRNSNIMRVLYYRYQFSTHPIPSKIKSAIFNNTIVNEYQANINVSDLDDNMPNNIIAMEYIFNKFKKLSVSHNFNLILVMDGDRQAIYDNSQSAVLVLNQEAKKIANKLKINFVDLEPIFRSDYKKNKRKFEFQNDNHWNAYAHKLVSQSIVNSGFLSQDRIVSFSH